MRLAMALTALLAAGTAAAEPRVARLEDAGTACSLDGLEADVEALIGRDPFDDAAGSAIRIETEVVGEGVVARLAIGDEQVRTLEGADCEELVESLAIVVVLVLRAEAPEPEPEPEPLPEPKREPEPEPRLAVAASVEVSPSPAPIALDVIAGGAAAGSGAGMAPELALGLRVSRGRARVGVELSLRAPDELAAGDGRVVVTTARATVLACFRGNIDLCAVGSGGVVRGSASGVVDARAASTPLAACGLRASWERPLTGRFALRVHAEARAALTTSRFLVDEMPVWTSSRVEAGAGLSLVAHIP
jgi:hypothetical protein